MLADSIINQKQIKQQPGLTEYLTERKKVW